MELKKRRIKYLIISIILIFIVAITCKYYDGARVRTGNEPKLVIKIINKEGTKVTYWGLGYKVIRYPSVSPNEPYKNNRGIKMGSWFMNYKLPENSDKLVIKEIIDKTKTMIIFSCAEALDQFYEDEQYQYYFNCLKSKYIIVKYQDGSEETVKEALKNNRIKISNLDEYKIDYIKYEK